MAGVLVLAFVILGLYLRSLNPEERVQFLRNTLNKARATVRTVREEIGRYQQDVRRLRRRFGSAPISPS